MLENDIIPSKNKREVEEMLESRRMDPVVFNLAGRRALVTGGGTGLGKEMAHALAIAGASVTICGRRLEPLSLAASELSDSADIRFIQYDVTRPREELIEFSRRVGDIDILVNNAGNVVRKPWLEVDSQDIMDAMIIHVESPLRLSQVFGPGMAERGFGRIINIVSIWGSSVQDPALYPGVGIDVAPYCLSKHAQLGLTRYLASVLGPTGVTVNAVSPGPMRVERNAGFYTGPVEKALNSASPVGRIGIPQDVSAAVTFLASDAASFITGLDLLVDGGSHVW